MTYGDIRDIQDLYCDDITFCQERCDWLSCPRNQKNIRDKTIPHSYSVEIPDDCPKKGKAVKRMPSREKVVKGLECCIKGNACSSDCPYFNETPITDGKCISESQADALALLKEQEAKTGHWIEKEDYNLDTYYDCSVCGESWTMIDGTPWENGMNYCPHCGAKMEGR